MYEANKPASRAHLSCRLLSRRERLPPLLFWAGLFLAVSSVSAQLLSGKTTSDGTIRRRHNHHPSTRGNIKCSAASACAIRLVFRFNNFNREKTEAISVSIFMRMSSVAHRRIVRIDACFHAGLGVASNPKGSVEEDVQFGASRIHITLNNPSVCPSRHELKPVPICCLHQTEDFCLQRCQSANSRCLRSVHCALSWREGIRGERTHRVPFRMQQSPRNSGFHLLHSRSPPPPPPPSPSRLSLRLPPVKAVKGVRKLHFLKAALQGTPAPLETAGRRSAVPPPSLSALW